MATTVISASSTAEDDHATTDRDHPLQWDISILRDGTFLLCAYRVIAYEKILCLIVMLNSFQHPFLVTNSGFSGTMDSEINSG
ncbi:hypothetical protein [Sphingobium sp. KCTC 72723]|uniref:hypothetical protein n=1 Tax=Sphingobium sp. KCTC 72723 TaxID=2733867 RepID=UPI00165E66CD|nr:hypothetical protein [Sphingobium sp. KCTC 72723]